MTPIPDHFGPGQESVWAYPRPAIAEPSGRRIAIIHRRVTIADTTRSIRTLETSHPPSYYIPQADIAMPMLARARRRSFCEWKGQAIYYDVVIDGAVIEEAAWSYPDPTPDFAALADYIAFYAAPFDLCTVDGERVTPQPGGFYGGWITSHVAGPFKGVPGSRFW
jgi:uncharacterized protein (DUF427 family)